LADLAELSKSLAVPDFIDFAMRAQMVYEGSVLEDLGGDRQSERIRRFGILLDSCRAFASRGGPGPDEYVGWFEQQREGGAFHSELPVVDPSAESVKVLTVHGAKGLEFPVVFVASFETQSRSDTATALVGKGGAGIEAKIGAKDAGVKTPGYDDAVEQAKKEEFAESIRLAYVAFTRARERLYVSLYGKASKSKKDSNKQRKEVAPRQAGDPATDPEVSALPKDPYDLVRNAIEKLFEHELFAKGEWVREPALEPQDAVEGGMAEDRRHVLFTHVSSAAMTAAAATKPPPATESQQKPVVWDKTCAGSMKRRLLLQRLSAEESGLAASIPVFSATDVATALAPYSFDAEGGDESPPDPDLEPAFSGDVVQETDAPAPATKARRSGRRISNADALRIGREVHEALASLDLSALGGATTGGISGAVAALKPALAAYASELVYKAIKSPVLALAGQSRHWKELYVCARSPKGAAVEGYCDLVIETQDGLIVVDYKTDALSAAPDKARLLEHYSMQLGAYAYALARATGLKVVGARILFLGDEELVEKEVDKLEERMQQIEDWLDGLALRREAIAKAIQS
jgi:ATP-dependent helicase/nuclease subunit A